MSLDSLEREVVEAYHLHQTDKTTLITADNLRKAYADGKWQNDMDYHEWLNLILGCKEKVPSVVNALMAGEYVSLFTAEKIVFRGTELVDPTSGATDAGVPLTSTDPATDLTDLEVPAEVLGEQTPVAIAEASASPETPDTATGDESGEEN